MLVLTLLPGCCFFGLNFCRLLSSQVLFSAAGDETGSACLPPLPSCPVLARSPWLWRQPLKMSEAAAGNFFHLWAGTFGRPRFLFVMPAVSSLPAVMKSFDLLRKLKWVPGRSYNLFTFTQVLVSQSLFNFHVIFLRPPCVAIWFWQPCGHTWYRRRFENMKHSCFHWNMFFKDYNDLWDDLVDDVVNDGGGVMNIAARVHGRSSSWPAGFLCKMVKTSSTHLAFSKTFPFLEFCICPNCQIYLYKLLNMFVC